MNICDAICIGEALIDFTPLEGEYTYVANPGGAPANVAVAIARNGIRTGFLGKIGEDHFGELITKRFQEKGVQLLCETPAKDAMTTMAFVTLDSNGERSFSFARKPGADMLLAVDDVKESVIGECRLLHVGSLGFSGASSREAIFYAMQTVARMGKIVSLDVNFRPTAMSLESAMGVMSMAMYMVDILKISEEELVFVGGKENIAGYMKQYGLKLVLVTLGAKGSDYYFNVNGNIHEGHVDGKAVQMKDSTGAGDAFLGTFLATLLKNEALTKETITEEEVKAAVVAGNAAGAECVQNKGGML